MNRILSMITPVYRPRADHLLAAYESLVSQEFPDGWEWEWIVQEDGSTGIARQLLPGDDERLVFGTGRRGGTATTRNLALSRARGELVKNLDQDDVLAPGALSRDVGALASDPSIGWVTSPALDLLEDGRTVGADTDPPAGPIAPGFVLRHWIEHGYRLPVHPGSLCIRRDLAVKLGGWMAVPGSDDTGLLMAASVVVAGYFHAEVGLLYRRWPGQSSADPAHIEPVEWNLRMNLIRSRAELLAGECSPAGTE